MDYSIKDALEAGFDRIVFIIRKDLEKDFKEVIGNRIEKIADVAYAYQELDDLPGGFTKPRRPDEALGNRARRFSMQGKLSMSPLRS